jgi:hypothetical protein
LMWLGLPVLIMCILLTLKVGTCWTILSWPFKKIKQWFYGAFPDKEKKKKLKDLEGGRKDTGTASGSPNQFRREEDSTQALAGPSQPPNAADPSVQRVDNTDGRADASPDDTIEPLDTADSSVPTASEADNSGESSQPSSSRRDVIDVVSNDRDTEVPAESIRLQSSPPDDLADNSDDDLPNGRDEDPSKTSTQPAKQVSSKYSDDLVIEYAVRMLILLVLCILAFLGVVLVENIWRKFLYPRCTKCFIAIGKVVKGLWKSAIENLC